MISVSLFKPLTFGSETIREININEPRAKDLEGIDVPKMTHGGEVRKILSRCSGVPDQVLGDMDLADFIRCMEVVFSFLENTQGTTKTARESSPSSSTSSLANLPNSEPAISTNG